MTRTITRHEQRVQQAAFPPYGQPWIGPTVPANWPAPWLSGPVPYAAPPSMTPQFFQPAVQPPSYGPGPYLSYPPPNTGARPPPYHVYGPGYGYY